MRPSGATLSGPQSKSVKKLSRIEVGQIHLADQTAVLVIRHASAASLGGRIMSMPGPDMVCDWLLTCCASAECHDSDAA